jgi:hypothetical protein
MTVRFEAGAQHMDGDRALIYARTRHQDDDYRRAGRQQQVVDAFLRRAANPLHWPALVGAVTAHVETDLTPLQFMQMLPVVLAERGGFDRLVLDRDYVQPGPGGVVPDYARIAPWIAAHFG